VGAVPSLEVDGFHGTSPQLVRANHRPHCRCDLCYGCGSCGGSEDAPRRIRRSERLDAVETAIQARNRDLAADESSSCRAESSKRNGGHSRETRNRIRVNTVSIDSIAVEHGSDDDPVNGAGL
jgi:hypothetical protein